MRKSYLLAVLAAGLGSLALVGSPAIAQQGTPLRNAPVQSPRGGSAVVLLDVNAVFKHHNRMRSMMKQMKDDVRRAEEEVRSERNAIVQLAKRLEEEITPGTRDYNALDVQLTERRTKLSIRIQLQKKEFLQREAKIFHTVYQEVLQEVNYYANANNVALVLRFNAARANPDQPQEILRDINKAVVWYAPPLDITQIVLDRLNQRAVNPNPGAPTGPARRPQQGVRFR